MAITPSRKPRNFSGDKFKVGDRHGLLVIAGEPFLAHEGPQRKLMAVVACDCGKRKVMRCSRFKSGVASCGCLKAVNALKANTKHGMEGTLIYGVWHDMLDRCRMANSRNRSNNTRLSAFGESKILVEWSEDSRCVVPYGLLVQRLTRGWEPAKAISTPRRPHFTEVSH